MKGLSSLPFEVCPRGLSSLHLPPGCPRGPLSLHSTSVSSLPLLAGVLAGLLRKTSIFAVYTVSSLIKVWGGAVPGRRVEQALQFQCV